MKCRTALLAFALTASGGLAACGHSPTKSGFTPAGGDGDGGGDGTADGTDDGGADDPGDDGGGLVGFAGEDSGPSWPGVDAGCATAKVTAHAAPAYLLFVLDGSNSMNAENKWAAVIPALGAIFKQFEASADPSIAAGLIVFGGAASTYPGPDDVAVDYVSTAHYQALEARLTSATLALLTPTGPALRGGYQELEAFTPQAPLLPRGKKVLVLITDGVPTGDCAPLGGAYASNACVTLAGEKKTEAAPAGPIDTFVVGVGDFPATNPASFDPQFLGNMAEAGGTSKKGCNVGEVSNESALCYFEIDPSKASSAAALQKSFVTALNAIRGQVASCTFPLESTGQIDPTKVNVVVAGKSILKDPANGWTYDNEAKPTAILLHGAACASGSTRVSSQGASVSIVLGCATQGIQ